MIFLHMHHFSVQSCILNVLADAAAQQKRSAEELFLFRFIPRHIKFYSRKLRFHDSKKRETHNNNNSSSHRYNGYYSFHANADASAT